MRLKSQPSGAISNKAENRDNQNFPVSKRLIHHLSVAEGTSQMLAAFLNSGERIKWISWKSFNSRARTRTEWPGLSLCLAETHYPQNAVLSAHTHCLGKIQRGQRSLSHLSDEAQIKTTGSAAS